MKHLLRKFACISAACISIFSAAAQTPTDIPWYGNKYSMFIHFGLYSTLGGVWNGRQVQGYSEQIQSHGGIYGDAYSDLAYDFDPQSFNADSLVALAKRAGMRSIVITSKHHDGFCLFRTATTDFNSWDWAPCHRDFMAELSDACHRGGVGFGMYYSLIDWHAPCADHITSHNATFITPEHHRLNMAQVEELVTNYGSVSEMWFDMGSLTPQQSKDIYDLVRIHQPDCMVSGRLGNGCYDFAVMSDNYYPESSLQTPWQSAASMFDETWGYRSWQQRGDPHAKVREKLCSLIRVVSGGGNFLLNIGPEGDGSVVPFEQQVLEEMGAWLHANGDVIYNTSASPFRSPFMWGAITCNGKRINLILSGEAPGDGTLLIPVGSCRLLTVDGPAKAAVKKIDGSRMLSVKLDADAYEGDIKVVRIDLDRDFATEVQDAVGEGSTIPARTANNSYFCQDYYTNARSDVSYTWSFDANKPVSTLELSYITSDIGKAVDVKIGDRTYTAILSDNPTHTIITEDVVESDRYVTHIPKHYFDSPQHYDFAPVTVTDGCRSAIWNQVPVDTVHGEFASRKMDTVYALETVTSPEEQDAVFEIGAGNGVQVYLNGDSVMKHLNPYRCTFRNELVRVHLKAGENKLLLRSYNRFEKKIPWLLRLSEEQNIHTAELSIEPVRGKVQVTISAHEPFSRHEDCQLHNVRVDVK